jgi:DNA-directed RNA polymerase specialized sigma24 family protein
MSTDFGRVTEEVEIKSFFKQMEAVRLRNGGDNRAPRSASCPRIVLSEIMARASRFRVPSVVWKTRLFCIHDAADELTQEFTVVAMEIGLEPFKAGYTYGQYLTSVLFEAANRLLDAHRHERHVQIGLPDIEFPVMLSEEEPPKPCHLRDPQKTVGRVLEVISEFPPELEQTASRVWLKGHKPEEVAADEKISINAVALRIYRMRRRLSTRLGIPLNLRDASHCRRRRRRRRRR